MNVGVPTEKGDLINKKAQEFEEVVSDDDSSVDSESSIDTNETGSTPDLKSSVTTYVFGWPKKCLLFQTKIRPNYNTKVIVPVFRC